MPFLFYVAHFFLLHAMAVVIASLSLGDIDWLFRGMPIFTKADDYGLSLSMVYVLWLVALALLYPLCKWFGALNSGAGIGS